MQKIILYLNSQEINDREGLLSAMGMLEPDSMDYYDLINFARTGDLKLWFCDNQLTSEAKHIEYINESTTDNEVIHMILKALSVNRNVPKVAFQSVFVLEDISMCVIENKTLLVKIIFNVVKHVNESYSLIVLSKESEQEVLLSPKDYVVNKSYIKSVTVPYNEDEKIILKCDNRFLKTLDYIDEAWNLEKCSNQGKYGFKDKRTGNIVIPCQYDLVQDFHDNIAIVGRNGKYGAIDTNGNNVIPCKYDSIDAFYNGRAIVKNGSLYGFLARETYKEVIPCQYEKVYPFTEWNATIADNAVIDRNGSILYEGFELHCFDGGFAVDKGHALVNTEGEVVYQGNVLAFSEGIIRFYDNTVNAQYFCKITGEKITDNFFEDGSSDFKEGIALIRKDGLYGYIDRMGHYILTPQFFEARDFHNGYAAVCKRYDTEGEYGIYWGFIDKDGENLFNIKEKKFKSVGDFCEGKATVSSIYEYGYVNTKGEFSFDQEIIPFNWGLWLFAGTCGLMFLLAIIGSFSSREKTESLYEDDIIIADTDTIIDPMPIDTIHTIEIDPEPSVFSPQFYVGKTYKGNGNRGGNPTELIVTFLDENQCKCTSNWYNAFQTKKTFIGKYKIKRDRLIIDCRVCHKDGVEYNYQFEFDIYKEGDFLSFDKTPSDAEGTIDHNWMEISLDKDSDFEKYEYFE